jgi:tripartite-type tricarboxylate transporter receptor subunit TctC
MEKSGKSLAIVLCCLLISVASSVAQENYPTKPIQIVGPFAAGGSLDLLSRIFSEKLRESLGQPVLVVPKPGANGAIAIEYVATSKPDGYNLYLSSGVSFGFLHVMNQNFSYGLKDFTPIAAVAKFPQVIVAKRDLPVNKFADLEGYAKKNPNTLSYASTGYSGGDHLSFESIKLALNLPDIQHVPYSGVAPALAALAGGQIQLACLPFSALVTKQIEAGAIRPLALLSTNRSPFRKDIPTIVEEGYPQLATLFYLCYWAPAKTPPAIVKKLEDTFRKACEDKATRAKIEDLYDEVDFQNSQELLKYAETQIARWTAVIKKLNIVIK